LDEAKLLYDHFLRGWKDADPDSIRFRTARAEYARLR
jgi:hypothetical protein